MSTRKVKMFKGSNSSATRKVDGVQVVDSLSSLPYNVLVKIFSFLTMKEALYTCFSCKKMKHLSTLIPNVEFDETAHGCFGKKRKFMQVVSRFLDNHEGGIRNFRLSFSPGGYESEVVHWLSLVVKHGIEELDLMFGTQNTLVVYIPDLAATTVKVMNLRNCRVEAPPVDVFKSVTSLHLGSLRIADDLMALFFSEFESLRHLNLEKCYGFEQIDIVDPNTKLETLILNDCQHLLRLNISRLKTLAIAKQEMNFSFVSDPCIERLTLFRQGHTRITPQESGNMKANIIGRLVTVKDLRLTGWAFKCFATYPSVQNYNSQFTNLKILELDVHVCLRNLTELNKFVSHAKGMQLLLISLKEDTSEDHAIYADSDFERRHLVNNKDNVDQNNVPICNHALTVEITGFKGTNFEKSYIKSVLAHYPHLSVLKVSVAEGVNIDKICAYQLLFWGFPRASADVKIIVGWDLELEA